MEEVSIGAREDYHLNELLAAFDAPAYIRRARGVETSLELLLSQAGAQRNEWLLMVKIHLATLEAVAGGWAQAGWLIANVEEMAALMRELSPRLRAKVSPNRWRMRGVARQLNRAIERFNQRWADYVPTIDLSGVNTLREGYNRWYVLEKSCALRNDAVARAGFVPIAMLTHQVIHERYPALPLVEFVGS